MIARAATFRSTVGRDAAVPRKRRLSDMVSEYKDGCPARGPSLAAVRRTSVRSRMSTTRSSRGARSKRGAAREAKSGASRNGSAAGKPKPPYPPQHQESIEDISDDQFERTFRTNIFGYFYMARAAIPQLKRGSAIVNTGSITGLQGSKELLDYSATKGAIHAFTKSLAQSLVEKKIRVNCIAPGPIWTPLNVADKEAMEAAKHGKETPMERPGQPEEVAPAYVFFASNADSSYITGEVLTLLGGETTAA